MPLGISPTRYKGTSMILCVSERVNGDIPIPLFHDTACHAVARQVEGDSFFPMNGRFPP